MLRRKLYFLPIFGVTMLNKQRGEYVDELKYISKKELLAKYNISYGTLYRWKRMGLIPDEWFIKTSAVTGQETFFIREVICERVELILEQKDNKASLDALSKQLSPKANNEKMLVIKTKYGDKSFRESEILSVEICGEQSLDVTEKIKELFGLI